MKQNLGEKIFTPEQKDRYLNLWVQNFKKMTGQIRKTAAKDALKQLQEEGLMLTGEVVEEIHAWDWDGKGEKRKGGEDMYCIRSIRIYWF